MEMQVGRPNWGLGMCSEHTLKQGDADREGMEKEEKEGATCVLESSNLCFRKLKKRAQVVM